MPPLFLVLLILALAFDFLNGFHDSANIVATVITSRSLHPRVALLLAAASEFAGPFLFGVAIATTVGDELLRLDIISLQVVIAALVAGVLWNLITWYLGIPSSSSHALLGGLLGGGVVSGGLAIVKLSGLVKILLALLISPIAGLLVGFLLMRFTLWSVRRATPSINQLFRRVQVATLIGLGLNKILGTIHTYPTLAQINRRVADQRLKEGLTPTAKKWIQRIFGPEK